MSDEQMSETASGSSTPPADDPFPGQGDVVATGTKGGGEWPDPGTRPTGAAPGSDPARAEALREQRQERTTDGDSPSEQLHPPTRKDDPYGGDAAATGSIGGAGADEPDEVAQDAGAARDRGPAPIGKPRTEQT